MSGFATQSAARSRPFGGLPNSEPPEKLLRAHRRCNLRVNYAPTGSPTAFASEVSASPACTLCESCSHVARRRRPTLNAQPRANLSQPLRTGSRPTVVRHTKFGPEAQTLVNATSKESPAPGATVLEGRDPTLAKCQRGLFVSGTKVPHDEDILQSVEFRATQVYGNLHESVIELRAIAVSASEEPNSAGSVLGSTHDTATSSRRSDPEGFQQSIRIKAA